MALSFIRAEWIIYERRDENKWSAVQLIIWSGAEIMWEEVKDNKCNVMLKGKWSGVESID